MEEKHENGYGKEKVDSFIHLLAINREELRFYYGMNEKLCGFTFLHLWSIFFAVFAKNTFGKIYTLVSFESKKFRIFDQLFITNKKRHTKKKYQEIF